VNAAGVGTITWDFSYAYMVRTDAYNPPTHTRMGIVTISEGAPQTLQINSIQSHNSCSTQSLAHANIAAIPIQ